MQTKRILRALFGIYIFWVAFLGYPSSSLSKTPTCEIMTTVAIRCRTILSKYAGKITTLQEEQNRNMKEMEQFSDSPNYEKSIGEMRLRHSIQVRNEANYLREDFASVILFTDGYENVKNCNNPRIDIGKCLSEYRKFIPPDTADSVSPKSAADR